jgi:hypothetical protein
MFVIKDFALTLYKRMLIKKDHLNNMIIQYPWEFIKAPSKKE